MKKIKLVLLVIGIILLTGCSKSNLKEISYKEYKNLIDSKESFILEVMREECSACKSFKPNLEAVIDKYNIEVKYINTDKLSDDELDEFGISGTPTLIFYNDGVEETTASRLVGSVSQDKIIAKFKANGFIK